ncbi:MAG: 50S ribosomal protein L3 [Fidelibacterota bacterium]
MTGLMGKKVGMTRLFGAGGESIPVTVIEAGPCVVTQVKRRSVDGYDAVQLGFGEQKEFRLNRPLKGHFKKAGVSPTRYLMEFPLEEGEDLKVGDTITVDLFREGDRVTVRGTSKGKGFTGVVKRYGFRGGPKTHGQSDRLRAPGSIGQSSNPSRVWPGLKMAGHHGNRKVVVRNLEVVRVDRETNSLFLKGAVPGARNGLVAVMK